MTPTTREGLRRQQQQQQQQQQQPSVDAQQQQQQQTAIAAAATPATKSKSPTPPPGKIKTQQQQQQQQHYQFRTPQQFVKQKNAAILKKQKTWSKRQHNKMCKQNVAANLIGAGQQLMVVSSCTGNVISNKADLENIQQNIKNQHHYHHYHHHHHHHHHGRLSGAAGGLAPGANSQAASGNNHNTTATAGTTANVNGLQSNTGNCSGGGGGGAAAAAVVAGTLEKLGYCHGYLKQQTYKKMSAHSRGAHHNHVLCAGAAHNTVGNNGGGVGGGGVNHTHCCSLNGCCNGVTVGIVDKDNNSISGASVNSSVAAANAAQHYCCGRSKFFLPEKRIRKDVFIPPTKFLLGGNISDPLNLNSLQNENANSNNNTPGNTPRQSPITTPPKVEVIIPPNIHDPLHLLDPVDSMEYEKQLTSPMKRGALRGGHLKMAHHSNKHRHRKNRKRRSRVDSESSAVAAAAAGATAANAGTSVLGNSTLPTGSVEIGTTIATATTQTTATAALSISLAETAKMEQIQQQHLGVSRVNESLMTATLLPKTTTTTTATVAATNTANSMLFVQQNVEQKLGEHSVVATSTLAGEQQLSNTVVAVSSQECLANSETLLLGNNEMKQLQQTQQQQQQHVGNCDLLLTTLAATATTTTATASAALASSLVERRGDLRLELNITNNSNSSGGSSSTCFTGNVGGLLTQQAVTTASGNVNAVGCSGGGNRKRKISESNNSQKSKKFYRHDAMDKIVSPVVPQPGTWKRPPRLQPTGARKMITRRSTSFSETELASPGDEIKPVLELEIPRDDTPEIFGKNDTIETSLASPLSTISGTTTLTAGEQDSLADMNAAADVSTASSENNKIESTAVGTITTAAPAAAAAEATAVAKMPKFRADGVKYRYGNFDRYTDFRQLNEFRDVRLQVFQRHLELFQNKDILDIGCNVGHMTISVARNLAPKSILGIDIDAGLIARARRHLSMFVRIPERSVETMEVKKEMPDETEKQAETATAAAATNAGQEKRHKKTRRKKRRHPKSRGIAAQRYHFLHHHHHHVHHYHSQREQLQRQRLQELYVPAKEFFPISFPLTYGGIPNLARISAAQQTNKTPNGNATTQQAISTNTNNSNGTGTAAGGNATTRRKNHFPDNVYFRQTNYVVKDESMLAIDIQQYDLILCLSVTKWIHLNFGDAGLKLAFKRMFNQLRPGGKLILEAQNWASYKKKKNLTPEIYKNYKDIEFFPNKFHEYLLSSEVGFSHSYTLGVPRHMNKGFCRPIQLYAKGDYTPNHVRWSDAYCPQTPYEAYRGIYATMTPRPLNGGSSVPLSLGGIGGGGLPISMSSTRSQNYDTPYYSGGASNSCRQTPMYQPTSQYYNPLETDSYQPSYDIEYLNHMYAFASPLYQTVWSPPTSLRRSSSHTPVFGSVRDAELDGDGGSIGGGGSSYHRHVYPPNDDTCSPNANTMGNAFNSIRDPDTDDSNQLPSGSRRYVYATNCGESSSSPQVNHHADAETIEALIMEDEQQQQQQQQQLQQQQSQSQSLTQNMTANSGNYCDLNDA